jgi:hypothetical protein
MSSNPCLPSVTNACLTYGIDEIADFKIADEIATFKGTYYHPSHRGETWIFVAHHRKNGGISITPVIHVSGQKAKASNPSIESDQEPSDSPEAKYDKETLEYLVGACQNLAGLQKTLRWHPEFLEEEKKVLDVCFAISHKISHHLDKNQEDKMKYMFY